VNNVYQRSERKSMNKFPTLIAAAGLAALSGSASAWWGPWNEGYNGYNDGFGDGVTDMFGDGGFNTNLRSHGGGRGSSRGYDYDRYYGGYAPYYGYAPYGYAPYGYAPYPAVPPFEGAAVPPPPDEDFVKAQNDAFEARQKAASEHFKQMEEQRNAALKQMEEQRKAMQKSYEEMMKSRQAMWENRYASGAPAVGVAR
jgi:hypothetical protein